jgi:hypothetical protein
MAKKSARRASRSFALHREDFSSWNFIIFLTLAFLLLVIVLTMMRSVAQDVRTKAGLACPQVTLPRAEDCPGGEWKFKRASDGCEIFVCDPTDASSNRQDLLRNPNK